ncbi:uncharacterized protein CLUP02_04009 [Colletotrichum lupini]|uniref:Uncharacterized protein n=1 Tax=Colletotrichum lupini TaxID=145971 RepID=A0A9Q8WD99_9PEZI|nr:uncharacterized protein CLUP02_04009 [Colletotrichum lupini]UQC78532.1 hypothetical protein CLUP02_04009 [Colletotrichum lupini]
MKLILLCQHSSSPFIILSFFTRPSCCFGLTDRLSWAHHAREIALRFYLSPLSWRQHHLALGTRSHRGNTGLLKLPKRPRVYGIDRGGPARRARRNLRDQTRDGYSRQAEETSEQLWFDLWQKPGDGRKARGPRLFTSEIDKSASFLGLGTRRGDACREKNIAPSSPLIRLNWVSVQSTDQRYPDKLHLYLLSGALKHRMHRARKSLHETSNQLATSLPTSSYSLPNYLLRILLITARPAAALLRLSPVLCFALCFDILHPTTIHPPTCHRQPPRIGISYIQLPSAPYKPPHPPHEPVTPYFLISICVPPILRLETHASIHLNSSLTDAIANPTTSEPTE